MAIRPRTFLQEGFPVMCAAFSATLGLRTPLSIISGALGRISRELEKEQISRLNQTIERGQRNVLRLQDLQIKIADIVNRKPHEESGTIIGIIEDALNLVEELREEDFRDGVELVLERLSARLNDVYGPKEACVEKIDLEMLLDEVYQEALLAMKERQLVIIPDFEKGLFLEMDIDIVKKICAGLLRNAIENTPDEGRIEIGSRSKNGLVEIDFRDYGVGITTVNQNLIFGGFFHTQETDSYASKRPYAFSAGGTGSDLLRTKIFSERYGFSVDFETSRCNHLPEDKDACPGRISACSFIKDKSECLSSGGSVFSLSFPME